MRFEVLSRGITIEQLQVFTRVIETGSLMAAAGGEKSLQSSYSKRLSALEGALEKKLFAREGRGLALTEDGRKLAVMVNAFFASLDEFAFGISAKTIRVGAGESVLESFVYPRFKTLREALPEICFEFVSLSTSRTVEALKTGRIEFGMIRDDADLSDCEFLPLGEMEFELVIPRKLLPQGDIAAFGQVKQLPVATLSGQGRFVTSLKKLAEKEGFDLRIVASADSFSKVVQFSQTSDLAAFVPRGFASNFPKDAYSQYRTDDFAILSRSIVLAVTKSAVELRPALDRVFRQMARIVKL